MLVINWPIEKLVSCDNIVFWGIIHHWVYVVFKKRLLKKNPPGLGVISMFKY